MQGEVILEVGSGSGRFTEQAASTGAMVVSMDYSCAVEANYASNRGKKNVLIVQADVYRMPFKEGYFDKIFCFGVLQHTPNVRRTFMSLPPHLKSGGSLVVDVYRRHSWLKRLITPKNWARLITPRLPHEFLYSCVKRYIGLMWPLARLINRLPRGRTINFMLLIADYRGVYDLSEDQLKEWAMLDTFDWLSPKYDAPQTTQALRQWFTEAGMRDIEVDHGHNGIEGRGIKSR
jgi:SAM-dependent methyltransferase